MIGNVRFMVNYDEILSYFIDKLWMKQSLVYKLGWMKQTYFISMHCLIVSSIYRGSMHEGIPPMLGTIFVFS